MVFCTGGFLEVDKTDLTINKLDIEIIDLEAENQEAYNVVMKAILVISSLEMDDLDEHFLKIRHDMIDQTEPEYAFDKYLKEYTNVIHPAISSNITVLQSGKKILVYQGNYDYYVQYVDHPDLGKYIELLARARQ